ncbi:MAG: S8 family serine peptidase, partial [Tepidisphaeraceae bacterium]
MQFQDINGNGTRDGGDAALAGWIVYLDENSNGVFDGTSQTLASPNVPQAINDVQTTNSTLSVSGITDPIWDVNVTLSISHTYDSDLDVFLISPTGTRVELFTDTGGAGDNFTGTTLDDETTLSISSASAPFAGRFRPEGLLADLQNQTANGIWTLEASDDALGDGGVLNSWSLTFSTGERSCVTDSTGHYEFTELTAGTHVVRELGQVGWTPTAPAGGAYTLSLGAGDVVTGQDFGARQPPGEISGLVFSDRNGDGIRQDAEQPLAGWIVFIDANNNGSLDGAETTAITNGQGEYRIGDLQPGSYTIREFLPVGWTQTLPSPGGGGSLNSTVSQPTRPKRAYTNTEIIAQISGNKGLATLRKYLKSGTGAKLARFVDLAHTRTLFTGKTTTLQVGLKKGISAARLINALKPISFVKWASPNYLYNDIKARDFVANDPLISAQYFHTIMHNDQAWDTTLGSSSVVVAVTDDGFDMTHPDLASGIWTNPDEIPGDSIDNDNNGYVDDVHGWDFSADDNDPSENVFDVHGTHVAGIVGARTNNAIGVAGTAGGSTVMPIRFYGTNPWTSAVIAASYAYAVDNGAKIISTSYNVDSFVGDPTFVAGIQYLYDHGGLHFNSAGNNNQLNPPRQVFEQSLFVANTNQFDSKAFSSNFGRGIDLSAPGELIYSTVPGNDYGYSSGTSMATPNAAGVAALIWSVHPTWTREQVAAQLIGTTDNINSQNQAYIGLLGSGRVNSFRAVTDTIAPPTLQNLLGLPPEGGATSLLPTTFTIDTHSVWVPGSMNDVANWQLRGAGRDAVFDTADDFTVAITRNTNYMIGTNRLSFTITGDMYSGKYQLRALTSLTDPFGAAI